jgi:ribosomal protein S18 acetylase RimI-like enzyme
MAKQRGHGSIGLSVGCSNDAARTLYEHIGFVPARTTMFMPIEPNDPTTG